MYLTEFYIILISWWAFVLQFFVFSVFFGGGGRGVRVEGVVILVQCICGTLLKVFWYSCLWLLLTRVSKWVCVKHCVVIGWFPKRLFIAKGTLDTIDTITWQLWWELEQWYIRNAQEPCTENYSSYRCRSMMQIMWSETHLPAYHTSWFVFLVRLSSH